MVLTGFIIFLLEINDLKDENEIYSWGSGCYGECGFGEVIE